MRQKGLTSLQHTLVCLFLVLTSGIPPEMYAYRVNTAYIRKPSGITPVTMDFR